MPEVTSRASSVSEIPRVREILVAAQQEMGREGGVVMEGRDIGTVVFPDADVKVWLEADLPTRALRRREELAAKGIDVPLPEIMDDLERRDEHDSGRDRSPLQRAPDAIRIDTSGLTIDEQVTRLEGLVRKRDEEATDGNH